MYFNPKKAYVSVVTSHFSCTLLIEFSQKVSQEEKTPRIQESAIIEHHSQATPRRAIPGLPHLAYSLAWLCTYTACSD